MSSRPMPSSTCIAECRVTRTSRRRSTEYLYAHVPVAPAGRHPSWCKLRWVLDNAIKGRWKAVMVLDTDAWIHDVQRFRDFIAPWLADNSKSLAFAAEPDFAGSYITHKQSFNGGMMLFKCVPRVFAYFQAVWDSPDRVPALAQHKMQWSWEQVCLNYVMDQMDAAFRNACDILPLYDWNTPCGEIVRHSWCKNIVEDLAYDSLI